MGDELTGRKKYFANARIDSGRHRNPQYDNIHDKVVMRELHALHFPSCSGRKAYGAGHILGASALEIEGWESFSGFCADNVIWELLHVSKITRIAIDPQNVSSEK